MDFPFTLPGHEQIPLAIRFNVWGTRNVIHAGKPLKRITWRSQEFALPLSDGSELKLVLKIQNLNFFVPTVVFNGQAISVISPLPVYQYAFIYLPLMMVFIGGALGGLCGACAVDLNLRIFYGRQGTAIKVLLSILTCLGSAILWFIALLIVHFIFFKPPDWGFTGK